MINVKENEDGSFTISWDPQDPQESIFNDYTEEDFTNLIQDYCNKIITEAESDSDKFKEKFATAGHLGIPFTGAKEYDIDQTAEEVEEDIETLRQFVREDEDDERLPRLFF